MLIDWFTVGAQVLNFIILVWLLKRFLYKPILDAIDARETKIAAQLADAQDQKMEAQQEREDYERKIDDIAQQRLALLSKATDEANSERQRILEAARQAADTLSAGRQETLRKEAARLSEAITRKVAQEVFAISRKALTDLAGESLEERMSEVFMQRLRTMTDATREKLATALHTSEKPAVLRSAFDLLPAQQDSIRSAVNETFAEEVTLRFETDPELVCGIELATEDQRVSWSITEYLGSLDRGFSALLKSDSGAGIMSNAEPGASLA